MSAMSSKKDSVIYSLIEQSKVQRKCANWCVVITVFISICLLSSFFIFGIEADEDSDKSLHQRIDLMDKIGKLEDKLKPKKEELSKYSFFVNGPMDYGHFDNELYGRILLEDAAERTPADWGDKSKDKKVDIEEEKTVSDWGSGTRVLRSSLGRIIKPRNYKNWYIYQDYEIIKNEIQTYEKQITSLKKQLEKEQNVIISSEPSVIEIISFSVMRIGSVLISVFLIQILVNFTKYHYRMANQLTLLSDALNLTNEETWDLKEITSIFNIETRFGNTTVPPTDKIIEKLEKIIDKVKR